MADLLGISISGLRFSQSALKTSSHNITNADTEGYSRQRALAGTNPATFIGGSYAGNGVNLQSIERIASQFAIDQLRSDTTLFSELDTFNDNIAQIDSLLSDPATGVAAAMQSFFASVQNGANDPTSIPSRQLIVSEAENLATRFNTLYDRLDAINQGISQQMNTAISQINSLTQVIAGLNEKIALAVGQGQGAQPNDLLDQRDEALRQLAEFVSVNTFNQDGSQINVLVGNGQPLVVGNQARQLRLEDGLFDASKAEIVFDGEKGAQRITDLISGGQLGGLINFRNQVLDPTLNELGRIAIVLGESFNELHSQGVDLNGLYGRDFFSSANKGDIIYNRIKGSSENALPDDRRMALRVSDASQLTASDYELDITANGVYTITRLSDGELASQGIMASSFPFSVEFDGLTLEFEGGSFRSGDRFLIEPSRLGARLFNNEISSTEDIAFGSPLLTDASLSNKGSGSISAGEVLATRDASGNYLPLFANQGKFSPPLIVKFTSANTYDILDNSDPGNPKQLQPPIRNQRYVPGLANNLFGTDPGSTLATTAGRAIGLPDGSVPSLQAALKPTGAVNPNFAVSDFSASTDQFAFDVVVSNTLNGASDSTVTVLINSPGIVDSATLLADINDELAASAAEAYIDENGNLAFRMGSMGYGDITLQNYDPDPDGGLDLAPAGQANNLLGFNVEGASFTTVGGASGVSGQGIVGNGYPAEIVKVTHTDPLTGQPVTQQVTTSQNGSARLLASSLSNIPGVSANAHTSALLDNWNISLNEPLQLSINGENLLPYTANTVTGIPELDASIPDPATDLNGFITYVVDQINSNSSLVDQSGIYARVSVDGTTGRAGITLVSSLGDDLDIRLTALPGESIDVGDAVNPQVRLGSNGPGVQTGVVVGGRVDVTLVDGYRLETLPTNSQLFGDTSAPGFQQNNYWGIQASISGTPQTGDNFTLDFNHNATADNRNALALVDLELEKTIAGGNTFANAYGRVVEEVGTKTASSQINRDASEKILSQSQSLRDSIAGVNLEEEAANLIQYEQLYNANAQAISVARQLFDRLLNSF